MRELLPVSVLLVLILVPTADAQPVDEWIPNPVVTAGPPAVRVDPYLGVDPRFFTTGLQAELGLVPADLPLWYLPPIHAWQLPPQAYTGRQTGRVFVPRGNSPWEFVFDPYLAPYRTRRLYFPTGHHARIWHGQFKVNRPTRFLIVSREHAGGWTPEWEGAMRRTRNLKTLADAELRGGRPVQAALAYWQQTIRDPRDATAFLGLSDALLLLENYDWGGECAREGLRAEPRWLKARVDKRGFLDDPKPLEKAIAKLEEYVETRSAATFARFLLAYNYLFTGRAAEAIPHFEAAVEAWPWDPLPRQALAAARRRAEAKETR
jgi:hypothetical protein